LDVAQSMHEPFPLSGTNAGTLFASNVLQHIQVYVHIICYCDCVVTAGGMMQMGLLLVWVVLVAVEPAQNSCIAPKRGVITILLFDGCHSSHASQRYGVKPGLLGSQCQVM